MKNNYIDSLKEVLADRGSLTPDKLQSFMGQTMQYLTNLRQKMASNEATDREEAMNTALELKDILEAQMTALSQSMGVDFSQISERDLMDQMGDKEREVFTAAKEQFNEMKNSLPSKKVNRKERIKSTV